MAWKVPSHRPLACGAQQPLDPGLHLAGGLVGEGDRQDAVGTHAQGVDQVGDAVGEDAGLARAGAGQHQRRARRGSHRLALGGVESGEDVHRG